MLTLIAYLLRAGSLVKRGPEQQAIRSVSDELRRLDRRPASIPAP